MAAGAGMGTLVPLAMTVVGVLSILRARRRGRANEDSSEQDRRASAAEMERRMASYLAARDSDRMAAGRSAQED